MKPLHAGYLLCVSAGLATATAGVLPWAAVTGAGTFTALQLHLYEPLAVTVGAGVLVAGLALMRTPWAAMAAMGNALGTIVIALSLHGDLLGALAALGVPLGNDFHIEGFGMYALVCSGFLSVAAAIVVSVQESPPVPTGKPAESVART